MSNQILVVKVGISDENRSRSNSMLASWKIGIDLIYDFNYVTKRPSRKLRLASMKPA